MALAGGGQRPAHQFRRRARRLLRPGRPPGGLMPLLQPWYRHSPWSGNLYREAPDAWLWRFGFARRDPMSAKSEIGKAVEAALAALLLGTITVADVYGYALRLFDEAMQGEIVPERSDIQPICGNAVTAIQAIPGKLMTFQSVYRLDAGERYGLAHAVKCKSDYTFDTQIVDLKVTWRAPSNDAAKFAHVAQLGTYHALTGKPQSLLYITPKKIVPVTLTETQLVDGWKTMLATWKRIDALERAVSTPEQGAQLLPLN